MKRLLSISAFLMLATIALGQGFADYQSMFWNQLANTCRENLRWQKSIEEEGEKESKTFVLDCSKGRMQDAGESLPMDLEEFSYLFEYHFDNPKYQGWLDLEQNAGSTKAKVKPGYASKCPLQSQEFIMANGKIQQASAHIFRETALYDLDIEINVHFDSAGKYSHHTLKSKSDVLWSGGITTLIEGRLLP